VKQAVVIVISLLALAMSAWGAPKATAKAPTWLDTIPPRIELLPKEHYHNKLVLVTARSNKPATIWISRNARDRFEEYKNAVAVADGGRTVLYFYGEDLLGNKSAIDSISYVVDFNPPQLTMVPPSGHFRSPVGIRISANEPARLYLQRTLNDLPGKPIGDSLYVKDRLQGYIAAVDSAGNRTISERIYYVVDTGKVTVRLSPDPGIFNRELKLGFSAIPRADVFFSLDPLAPPDLFAKYVTPVDLPYGLTVVRYFARDTAGMAGSIEKATYVIDTIPPRIRLERAEGGIFDTVTLTTREPAVIRYTVTRDLPGDQSEIYTGPIAVPRAGIGRVNVFARDSAGNRSDILEWSFRYDSIPPVISVAPPGGTFNKPVEIRFGASESAHFLYTVDGTSPRQNGMLYHNNVVISKEGTTVLRAIGFDEGENYSKEVIDTFILDTKPPVAKARIEVGPDQTGFFLTFTSDKPSTIYYETNGAVPTRASPQYLNRIALQTGQVIKYFAVDKVGNAGPVVVLDELRKPLVSAAPEPGIYNHRVRVAFTTSVASTVYWRILPDTAFFPLRDSLTLATEGTTILEYYAETRAGLRSAIRRQEYVLDLTAPHVTVSVKKGMGDTANIFFQSTENASIYYTLDGSNPQYSNTFRVAGNKLRMSTDRISVRRSRDLKLAYYAEDVAGNQSGLTVLDVFRPHAVPNVPAGPDRTYDKVLSLTFSTLDQSEIYFAHHGHAPTIDSAVFREPITLMRSDTICTFVIDASGYMGEVDTFVYLIHLPPSPVFSINPSPEKILVGESITFDASATVDNESPLTALKFRWNFGLDTVFESRYGPVATHTFVKAGLDTVTLEVSNPLGRTAVSKKEIRILDRCTEGMVFVVDRTGRTFCIDRYEWPNISKQVPFTSVSWVEAKMYCIEAGKRLCSAKEWAGACQGLSNEPYPYGGVYDQGRCPTAGEQPWPSGSFPRCRDGFGTADMLGNVWEWVNDRNGDNPLMMGGSYRMGRNANCRQSSPGTVAFHASDVGFRCCK
jgi:hypothetical protein